MIGIRSRDMHSETELYFILLHMSTQARGNTPQIEDLSFLLIQGSWKSHAQLQPCNHNRRAPRVMQVHLYYFREDEVYVLLFHLTF